MPPQMTDPREEERGLILFTKSVCLGCVGLKIVECCNCTMPDDELLLCRKYMGAVHLF